jgi:hypothetical protein
LPLDPSRKPGYKRCLQMQRAPLRQGEKTRLEEEFPALEAASTDLSSKFYALAATLYEAEVGLTKLNPLDPP